MNARFRALAVLIAVFLLGCSVGFLSYHLIMRSNVQASGGMIGARTPGRDRGGPRLQQLLELSPGQQAEFQGILREFRPQFDALRTEEGKRLDPIRAEMAPKFDGIRAEMNRRISSILNEDQRKKFEALHNGREGPPVLGRPGGGRHRPDHPGPPPGGPR